MLSFHWAVGRAVCSPQRRLQLFTTVVGLVYVVCCLETPSLTFAELPRVFATDFHTRRGFFHVLRWLESVHSGDDLTAFRTALSAYHRAGGDSDAHPFNRASPTVQFRSAQELRAFTSSAFNWETCQLLSKTGLQWAIVVYLARAKVLSQRVAIACVCCCILSLACATVAQSCVRELLFQAVSPSTHASPPPPPTNTAFMAALLRTLFFCRLAASIVVNVVLARGYQAYFGGRPERWKDVPRYLGSKRLALSTLFYGGASVSVMAISTPSLRSLSEAVAHIESVALGGAFAHFVVKMFGFGLAAEVAPTSGTHTPAKTKTG